MNPDELRMLAEDFARKEFPGERHHAKLGFIAGARSQADEIARLTKAGHALALAAGALNAATDNEACLIGERQAVLDAMKCWLQALGGTHD